MTAVPAWGRHTMAHLAGNSVGQISWPPLIQVPSALSWAEVAVPQGLGGCLSILDWGSKLMAQLLCPSPGHGAPIWGMAGKGNPAVGVKSQGCTARHQ